MSQTYTSNELRVNNGDTTTHDTTTVSENINILSAECRWKGVTTSDTTTSTEYQTESSDALYPSFEQDYAGQAFPDADSKPGPDWEFERHELIISHIDNTEHTVELNFWEVINNGSLVQRGFGTTDTLFGTVTGNSAVLWSSTTKYSDLTFGINVDSATECPDDQSDLLVRAQTVWSKTTSSTTYTDTQDPSASGDVSGSYSGTIGNGNWTSWQTLSGLATGNNQFNHTIGGSGEAYFQFRYTYERTLPDPVGGRLRIAADSVTYEVAVADSSDTRLESTALRIGNDGTYVIDMVPADGGFDTVPLTLSGPNGPLSPRIYNTIS